MNLVEELDTAAKNALAFAPQYIPQSLLYAAAREIERLERELVECKADAKDWKNRYEGMAILHSNKVRMIENGDLVRHVNVLKIEKERDSLAAQVVQMREALEWADGWIPAKATDEYRQGKDGCTCPMCKALEMSGEYA